MDEYKALLNEKIGDVVSKAKEFGDSTGITDVYSDGISRAKSYAKIAKLNAEINRQSDELRRVYVEIGRLYYEMNESKPESIYAPLFAQIKELGAVIAEKNAEIDSVREEIAERSRRRSAKVSEEPAEDVSTEDIEVEIFEESESSDSPAENE